MKTIGILETGPRAPELDSFKTYPGMVEDWLSDTGAAFTTYSVMNMEFPTAPDAHDLWVITGSKFGAYEDHAWIPPLEEFIRACRSANIPMVGICFGHQIMAQALGGVVRKSDKGWGVGIHDYTLTDWPEDLGTAPDGIHLQAYHQDQVEALPEGAQTIATSDFCEHAALWYPGWGFSVQGHPEFDKDYATDLIRLREGILLTSDQAQKAVDTQSKTPNADALAAAVAQAFLKG